MILDDILAAHAAAICRARSGAAARRAGARRGRRARAAQFARGAAPRRARSTCIAEFKRRSPSAGWIRRGRRRRPRSRGPTQRGRRGGAVGADRRAVLRRRAGRSGAARARRRACRCCARTSSSIEYQVVEARAAGADAVLLIVRALDDARPARRCSATRALGLERWSRRTTPPRSSARSPRARGMIGINHRDLRTLHHRPRAGGAAAPPHSRRRRGRRRVGDPRRRRRARGCGAAGIDAMLVGETLMRAPDPGGRAAGAARGAPRERCLVKICGVTTPRTPQRRPRRAPTRSA